MTPTPRIYALIVAAGTGSRAGGALPKQYHPLGGKPMLRHSCERLAHHPAIMGVQLVIHPDHHALYAQATEGLTLLPQVYGGSTRTDSVRAGLNALAFYHPDYVLIHDAARPFLPTQVLDALIEKLSPDCAAVPALAVADTVRRYVDGAWTEIDREGLLRIQTPQLFPFAPLKQLFDHFPSPRRGEDGRGAATYRSGEADVLGSPPANFPPMGGGTFTDEAALWLAAGLPLTYITGAEELRKVTTAEDIHDAEIYGDNRPHQPRRTAVGMGYDVHTLMPSGEKHTMRLGGIDIDHDHKLHGHSDADVVLHAIVDALLGALAEGDIGAHFPPSDERLKGADSRLFMDKARERVTAREGIIQHVDVTIICEQPKVGPHRDAMRTAIAAMLQLPPSRVSIKATTTEKLGFTGRSEGIAAQAVATVSLPEDIA